MRSLQDWMKYLEQQEQSVQENSSEPLLDQEIVGPEITLDDVPFPPMADTPMVTSVTPVDDADPSAAAVEEAVRLRKTPPPPPRPAGKPVKIKKPEIKEAKETRQQLLQRLLDPLISLEEAAKLLEVCPTTVRRYTNKGLLKHVRTAGNQRRFKLSDILGFLESAGR